MRLGLAVASVVMVSRAWAGPKGLPEPAPEVRNAGASIDLPAIPDFVLPPADGDAHDPRELRVAGAKLLDTRVKVRGYITWIYDCNAAIRQPHESRAHAQKRIDDDQTLCERAKFYIGSTKMTPADKSVWVVDVPRPPYKLERERLLKEELAAWPKVPKLAVGDYVVLTGEFKLRSPHNEASSDGLIVFASLEHAKPPKTAPVVAPVASTPLAPLPAGKAPVAPPESPVDPKVRDASVAELEAGNKANGQRQFDDALAHYQAAIKAWPGNHLAWYGVGAARAAKGEWERALEGFEKARAIRPDFAMYAMWCGVAAYERTVQAAREDEAKKRGVPAEQVMPDRSALVFDDARARLEAAVAIEPQLWRAHYYLGRIARDHGQARAAAEAFTRALVANPREQGPYVALTELYRRWDYTDQAIQVASQGTVNVPGETSDIFYVLGLAYDDKHDDTKAIEQFTRAIDAKADNWKAYFQRGQAYYRTKQRAKAKSDLERFAKNGGPQLAFAIQQANKMLADL